MAHTLCLMHASTCCAQPSRALRLPRHTHTLVSCIHACTAQHKHTRTTVLSLPECCTHFIHEHASLLSTCQPFSFDVSDRTSLIHHQGFALLTDQFCSVHCKQLTLSAAASSADTRCKKTFWRLVVTFLFFGLCIQTYFMTQITVDKYYESLGECVRM